MASVAYLCLTAALASRAGALRVPTVQAGSTSRSPALPGRIKQKLGNLRDLQYYGDLDIGTSPQTVKGIFDTGSFELVVFSKQCSSCGIAGVYDEKASSTFVQGNSTMVHAYGSGECTAQDGYDTVSIQRFGARRQPMWLAESCRMPLLTQASFNAIVGMGPPGQPVFTANQQLKELQELAGKFTENNESVPQDVRDMQTKVRQELEVAMQKPSLLEKLGVKTFSTCLGKKAGSPGWLFWNDHTRAGRAGVMKIPVVGNITWGVQVRTMAIAGTAFQMEAGCPNGCGGIVDTGTSLFAVPSDIYENIAQAIMANGLANDCTDLHHFPDLTMTVGGQELRFPPSSYVGSIYGEMDHRMRPYMRRNFLNTSYTTSPCQLLLMDLGAPQQTNLGPMMIIGMPFFREYYTTFDLGSGPGHRSIYISEADGSCKPMVGSQMKRDRIGDQAWRWKPRQVDASKIRMPHWLGHRIPLV